MVPVIIVLAALLAVAVPVGLYWTFLRVAGQHEADPTKVDHDVLDHPSQNWSQGGGRAAGRR
jgi:hypothetical protein